MPGFILHLAESEMILSELNYSETEKNLFRLGALLPDTMVTAKKQMSHFWSDEIMENLAKAPNVDNFYEKYKGKLSNPMVMGYYAHLCLDAAFVKDLWPEISIFLNEKGEVEGIDKKVSKVRVLKRGEVIDRERYFSKEYYYGDYSRMNGYCLKMYDIHIPKFDEKIQCPIEEVNYEDVKNVIDKLGRLKAESRLGQEEDLHVFDLSRLEKFIKEQAEQFKINNKI